MPAPTVTNIYVRLIDTAERVMRGRVASDREVVEQIAGEIAPTTARLIYDEERLLVQCLDRVIAARDLNDVARQILWTQIAGVLLPIVREHLSAAIVAQRAERAETTDQDYAKPR